MDGLLIDSEPLWQEAANEIFNKKGIYLTQEQYETSTGLRTVEFLDYWFTYFKLDKKKIPIVEIEIVDAVIEKVKTKGKILPGVDYIFNFFMERNFKIGLASSSPLSLIQEVVKLLGLEKKLNTISSAQDLKYGKPNPQVFLDCAEMLQSKPEHCICFEDSLNGLIAAKSAKMKCVVIPVAHQAHLNKWCIADLKLKSLEEFNQNHLNDLMM
jgi:mannitol-1-/sugar-/sorbitol-6-/2-deoxyglucose-6-phosphatase